MQTSTPWQVSFRQQVQPYSPEITLNVFKLKPMPRNDDIEVSVIERHPDYYGMIFGGVDEARTFAQSVGLL